MKTFMRFKIFTLLVFAFIFAAKTVYCEERVILYVTDNIHLGDNFVTKYADMLQTLMDDNYGKNTIRLKKFTRFDFNTTECFEFLKYFN
ncbi:MAG: hypothetical protein PHI20_01970 [Endomicrobiaceae bacterium]|nr:hypothetical protein [Endomicrobiaceae bacterium]